MVQVTGIIEFIQKLGENGAPGRWWFLRKETTQHINPTKQGYCLIMVPATGVIWSTVWSTIRPPASARAYPALLYMSLT